MHEFDPVFVYFATSILTVLVLWVILCLTNSNNDKLWQIGHNVSVATFAVAIAGPWMLAAFGHFIFQQPHHTLHHFSLNPLLCFFGALVGVLWFFLLNENMEAGIYCSWMSPIGALFAGILHWYILLFLAPIFWLECGLLWAERKYFIERKREQATRGKAEQDQDRTELQSARASAMDPLLAMEPRIRKELGLDEANRPLDD